MDERPDRPATSPVWDRAAARRAELCEPAVDTPPPRASMAPLLFVLLLVVVALVVVADVVHTMGWPPPAPP